MVVFGDEEYKIHARTQTHKHTHTQITNYTQHKAHLGLHGAGAGERAVPCLALRRRAHFALCHAEKEKKKRKKERKKESLNERKNNRTQQVPTG